MRLAVVGAGGVEGPLAGPVACAGLEVALLAALLPPARSARGEAPQTAPM